MNVRRDGRSFASGFMLAVGVIGGGAFTTHPAVAQSALAAMQNAVSCATTAACVSGGNTRSGPGVAGTSASGFGVSGTSATGKGINGTSTSNVAIEGSSNTSYGVEAVSKTSYGLWAATTNGPAAIMGTSSANGGFGVYGYTAASPYGYALFGYAPNGGFGMYGESGGNGDAVVGNAGGAGNGMTGLSSSGLGVEGYSSSGAGVQGSSNAWYGVVGSTSDGLAGVIGEASGAGNYALYGFNTANANGAGGTGVYGVAEASGTGVYGTTTYGAGDGVVGSVNGTGTGVYGSSSTGDGVAASSLNGYGVIGTSLTSTGVYANSTSGDAIDAKSTSGFGLNAYSQNLAGVVASSFKAAGVYATSTAGDGVAASSTTGDGVYASSYNHNGVEATSEDGNAILGDSTYGAGLIGLAFNSHPSIEGYSVSGGYSFAGYDYYSGTNTFYVDDAGNIGYTGNMNNFARIHGGAMVKTFSPKTATPTVEDTGTAQLVAGAAAVRLDAVFVATIDPQVTYRVFLTPGGDSNGLYVAQKSAAGFLVRESRGGHSTISFDYRIVATAAGQAAQRMSVADVTAMPLRSSVRLAAAAHVGQKISMQMHPKLPPAPRVLPVRAPILPPITLPRPPSQSAMVPGGPR